MREITHEPVSDATIGARAKAAREWMGLTQEQACRALALGRASLSSMENGTTKISAVLLYQMAHFYGVPYEYFYGADPFESYASGPRRHHLFSLMERLDKADRDQVAMFVEFLAFVRARQ